MRAVSAPVMFAINLVFACGAIAPARAQSPATEPGAQREGTRECQSITDPAQRARCFNEIQPRAGTAGTPANSDNPLPKNTPAEIDLTRGQPNAAAPGPQPPPRQGPPPQ